MAINNIKELNIRLFFKGFGASDSKQGVNSLVELDELLNKYTDFYQTNDIVWVVSEASFYILDMSGPNPAYTVFSVGGGGSANVSIYYGGQDNIAAYRTGDANFKPSAVGYNNEDAIIASRAVTGTNPVINRFDIYEVSIPQAGAEAYVFAGSIIGTQGAAGSDGNKGDKGDQGDPLVIDAQGNLIDRDVNCSNFPSGYSYLAIDTGELYFKTSALGIAPCTWGAPIPFGKGDTGATTYFVYQRATTIPTTPPIDTPNIPPGWSDGPPTGLAGEWLWMSSAIYSLDAGGTPTGTITWTTPVQIDGEDGLDGTEGIDTGFWIMWSESESPNEVGLPKPINYALDLTGFPDWFDDIDNTKAPIWMAQIRYDSLTKTWLDWQFSRIAGEEPPYKINMFMRSVSQPATPSGGLPYKQVDGSFSSGADAATANPGWSDTTPAGTDTLYMTELVLYKGPTNADWSVPFQLDGVEGTSTGIWTIWSESATKPAPPAPVENIISADGSSLDLSGSPAWQDDVDAPSITPKYMAQSFYKPDVGGATYSWTAWAVVQILGEDGSVGIPGTAARTYIPSSMFTRSDDPAIANTNITALYLTGDDINGWNIWGQLPNTPNDGDTTAPDTISLDLNGTTYIFTDGIPPVTSTGPNSSLRVWQINTVMNSVDNNGYNNKANWGFPVLLADTSNSNYAYHDGIDPDNSKPILDPGDGNDNGWYDDPISNTYWMAQINYSEGVSAQWKWWRIKGETGNDGADGSSATSMYTQWHPYDPTNPNRVYTQLEIETFLGTPDTSAQWDSTSYPTTILKTPGSLGTTILASYYRMKFSNGAWGSLIQIAQQTYDYSGLQLKGSNTTEFVTGSTDEVIKNVRPGDIAKVVLAPVGFPFNGGDIIKLSTFPAKLASSWILESGSAAYTSFIMSSTGQSSSTDSCNTLINFTAFYHNNVSLSYPEVGDTIYTLSTGTIFNGQSNWYAMDNGWAIQISSSGIVLQLVSCGSGPI